MLFRMQRACLLLIIILDSVLSFDAKPSTQKFDGINGDELTQALQPIVDELASRWNVSMYLGFKSKDARISLAGGIHLGVILLELVIIIIMIIIIIIISISLLFQIALFISCFFNLILIHL